MFLSDTVSIARRFQRSIRIDTDFNNPSALEGYISTKSSTDVLIAMARHVKETSQGAFTWTGPYGSGKSSLVVLLASLLSSDKKLKKVAAESIGVENAECFWQAFSKTKNWKILPVVGRKETPTQLFSEILEKFNPDLAKIKRPLKEVEIVEGFFDIAKRSEACDQGLVLIIDEMGKCLEAAGQEGSDIYIFQQLAEAASRSNGKFIIIGVLHQAFQEYATRLSREARDEWSKIQGRFVDLPVNVAGEEQVELMARAIISDRKTSRAGKLSSKTFDCIQKQKPSVSEFLQISLENCWPLHPVVACLLGPISRRRFGQNQRSLFAFLNSAEAHGFQDFLKSAMEKDLYEPERLWEYLRQNLEPSILASPDGHRWALATEAVERCESLSRDELHLKLLKAIALIDLFKGSSGLSASFELLCECCSHKNKQAVKDALKQLQAWSLIIFRKFSDSFVIFAGSDFDIDAALEEVMPEVQDLDFAFLKETAGIQPILAKRFYHQVGSMFWMDVDLAPLHQLQEKVKEFSPGNGSVGLFLLGIPTRNETDEEANKVCREAARLVDDLDIVTGCSPRAWQIVSLTREILALEKLKRNFRELDGDAVAKKEIQARLIVLQSQLETDLQKLFDQATWYRKHHQPKSFSYIDLNHIASEIAEKQYPNSPVIFSELMNRTKPSVSAVTAQNILLKKMVQGAGEPRLGISGFSAEVGLCVTILENTGLYGEVQNEWNFILPKGGKKDSGNLFPLWHATKEFLNSNSDRPVNVKEIYEFWRQPPFGLKDGLMPILLVAFLQTMRENISFYRQEIFQTDLKEIDIEHLVSAPATISLRIMDLSGIANRLLVELASVVRQLDEFNKLAHLEPIDVARGLISIFDSLAPLTKRTMKLSGNAIKIRLLFNKAKDPNKFLFDDIPATFSKNPDSINDKQVIEIAETVKLGLLELKNSFPEMLEHMKDRLLNSLQVPNSSPQALQELRDRATNVRHVGGDLRFEGFVTQLAKFDGSTNSIEGVIGFAAGKPVRDWIDQDIEKATLELAELTQKFIRLEAFAHVKGRTNKRHALAVVVGFAGQQKPLIEEFDISDNEKLLAKQIAAQISETLNQNAVGKRNLQLAVLAELGARLMEEKPQQLSLGLEIEAGEEK